MNVWVVTTPDVAQTAVFTTEKKAKKYLYSLACHMVCDTDCFSLWSVLTMQALESPFKPI